MAIDSVYIAGFPREVLLNSFQITESLQGTNTLSGDVLSQAGTYSPDIDDDIVIVEDGVTIFGGLIATAERRGFEGPNNTALVTHITARDYKDVLTVIFATLDLAADTVKSHLAYLIANTSITTHGISLAAGQVDGPTVGPFSFHKKRFDECLADISAATAAVGDQYFATISYAKKLEMYIPGTSSAPSDLIEADDSIEVGDLTIEPQRTQYANILYGFFGQGTKDLTERHNGDGVTRDFTLTERALATGNPMGFLTVFDSTSDVVMTPVGVYGVDTNLPWAYDVSTNQVRMHYRTTLSSPYYFEIYYTAQYPFELSAVDAAAVAAAGGRHFQDRIDRTDIFDRTVAQALLDGMIAARVARPNIAKFSTVVEGFHPGQIVHITSAKRAINADFLITDVTTRNEPNNDGLIRDITATDGPIQASWQQRIAAGYYGASPSTISLRITPPGAVGGGAQQPPTTTLGTGGVPSVHTGGGYNIHPDVITTVSLSGNTDLDVIGTGGQDWEPYQVVEITSATSTPVLTSIEAPSFSNTQGVFLWVLNKTSVSIPVLNRSGLAISATSEIVCPGDVDAVLGPYQGVLFYWSPNSGGLGIKWHWISATGGGLTYVPPTTPTFSAGDYTANSGGSWTVASGDVHRCSYSIVGNIMTLQLFLVTTSVTSAPSTVLNRVIPGGYSVPGECVIPVLAIDNNVERHGYAYVSGSNIAFGRTSGDPWATSSALTTIGATLVFEIS